MQDDPSENESIATLTEALDAVLVSLEGDTLSLEDAIVAYERGAKLIETVQERLGQAEQRVQIIESMAKDSTPVQAPEE